MNVAALDLLPLRERPGDILPLVWYFIERYGKRLKLNNVNLSADAEHALLDYAWPGNIRELENIIHHALLVSKNGNISTGDLHLNPDFGISQRRRSATTKGSSSLKSLENALATLYEQPAENLFDAIEEAVIRTAYAYCESNQVQTGRLLGIGRNILRHRLKRYGYLT